MLKSCSLEHHSKLQGSSPDNNYFKISIFFTTPFDEDLPIKLDCEQGRLTSDKLMLVYFVVQLSEETLINSKRIPTERGSPTLLTMKFL